MKTCVIVLLLMIVGLSFIFAEEYRVEWIAPNNVEVTPIITAKNTEDENIRVYDEGNKTSLGWEEVINRLAGVNKQLANWQDPKWIQAQIKELQDAKALLERVQAELEKVR